MRDPKRIDRILSMIERVWKLHPDLRLLQLLMNAIKTDLGDVYYVEDDDLEADLFDYMLKVVSEPITKEE